MIEVILYVCGAIIVGALALVGSVYAFCMSASYLRDVLAEIRKMRKNNKSERDAGKE